MRDSSAVPPLPVVGTCPRSRAVVIGLVFPGQAVGACVCRRPGIMGQRRDADAEGSQGGYGSGLERSERSERETEAEVEVEQGELRRAWTRGGLTRATQAEVDVVLRGGQVKRKNRHQGVRIPGAGACVVEESRNRYQVLGGKARRFVVQVEGAANESHQTLSPAMRGLDGDGKSEARQARRDGGEPGR